MEQQQPAKQRSPWVYIGIGCGALMLLFGMAFATIVWMMMSKARQLGEELKDPVTRTRKACEVLGCDQLPDGYYAGVSLSVPMLMEFTVLSDAEPDSDGGFTGFSQRGLFYMRFVDTGQDRSELRRYFEGKSNDASVLRKNNINVELKEVIRRGVVTQDGQTLLYLAQRGEAQTGAGVARGLQTVVLVECPKDKRTRMAIWFGPDPAPETPAAELATEGTVADEGELSSFLGHFHFCRGT